MRISTSWAYLFRRFILKIELSHLSGICFTLFLATVSAISVLKWKNEMNLSCITCYCLQTIQLDSVSWINYMIAHFPYLYNYISREHIVSCHMISPMSFYGIFISYLVLLQIEIDRTSVTLTSVYCVQSAQIENVF